MGSSRNSDNDSCKSCKSSQRWHFWCSSLYHGLYYSITFVYKKGVTLVNLLGTATPNRIERIIGFITLEQRPSSFIKSAQVSLSFQSDYCCLQFFYIKYWFALIWKLKPNLCYHKYLGNFVNQLLFMVTATLLIRT